MPDHETTVREAANALLTAINDAKVVGLVVRWPSFPGGLSVIAISATAKATVAGATPAAPQTAVPAAKATPATAAVSSAPLTPSPAVAQ